MGTRTRCGRLGLVLKSCSRYEQARWFKSCIVLLENLLLTIAVILQQEVSEERERLNGQVAELSSIVSVLTDDMAELQAELLVEAQAERDADYNPLGEHPLEQGPPSVSTLTLVDTKANKRTYKKEIVLKVQKLIMDFNLRGSKIDSLLHTTLSIFSGKSVAEVQQMVPLMKKSQMYVHGDLVSKLKHKQVSRAVKSIEREATLPFYALEADEGQVLGKKRMATLVTHTDLKTWNPVRHHVSAKPIPTTSAPVFSATRLSSGWWTQATSSWMCRNLQQNHLKLMCRSTR